MGFSRTRAGTLLAFVGPLPRFFYVKTFRCSSCQQIVFFENSRCENCGHALGFVPDERSMAAFEPQPDGKWTRAGAGPDAYRPCRNYVVENVCNWMVPDSDPHELCASCRFTQIIPALNKPENKEHWFQLERAKRRLIYSL